jgi:rhodanese-related sulfurtransferase
MGSLSGLGLSWVVAVLPTQSIPNQQIDYPQFQRFVVEGAQERESRRLSEADFLAALNEPGVVLLDARSAQRFAMLHIDGAVSLPFTEFTADTLAAIIPDRDTKILIYCNNNFRGDQVAFATKAPAASLNLSTWTSLRAYGYTNVWELGPVVDVQDTRLTLAGSRLRQPIASNDGAQ